VKANQQQKQPQSNVNTGSGGEFEAVMVKVRTKLAARGTRGFIGIQRQFKVIYNKFMKIFNFSIKKIMDDNNDKAINHQEFTKAMRDYKIELTEREVKLIFDEVDRDNNGTLSIDELVRSIQVNYLCVYLF